MSSIKAHAQVISVFGLLSSVIYGIVALINFAVQNGHSDYVWYTIGTIWAYVFIRPLYLIMLDYFKNGRPQSKNRVFHPLKSITYNHKIVPCRFGRVNAHILPRHSRGAISFLPVNSLFHVQGLVFFLFSGRMVPQFETKFRKEQENAIQSLPL